MTTQDAKHTKHTKLETLEREVLEEVAPSHLYGGPNPRAWRMHHMGAWFLRTRLNPYDSVIPIAAPNDNTWYSNAVTRLLLFPISLPYSFWKSRKKKLEMRDFVVAATRERKLRDVLDSEPPEEELNFVADVMNKEPEDVKAEIQAASVLADDEFKRQLALEWVGLHPGDFVFGEHDPKVAKLQNTFEEILSENP